MTPKEVKSGDEFYLTTKNRPIPIHVRACTNARRTIDGIWSFEVVGIINRETIQIEWKDQDEHQIKIQMVLSE